MLRIKLVRSLIGNNKRNRATVAALGLRKMQQVVEVPDNPSIRGMVHRVKHMIQVEVVEGEARKKPRRVPKAAEKREPAPRVAKRPTPKAIEVAPEPVLASAVQTESPKKSPAKPKAAAASAKPKVAKAAAKPKAAALASKPKPAKATKKKD